MTFLLWGRDCYAPKKSFDHFWVWLRWTSTQIYTERKEGYYTYIKLLETSDEEGWQAWESLF